MSINDTGAPLSMDAQHTNRYVLAVNDMQEVLQYLQSYQSIKQLQGVDRQEVIKTACQGILSAAIVAYCRPFLGNHSEGFAVCVFHGKVATNSTRKRPPIPRQTGH